MKKTVLITGASRGIGKETALLYAKMGYNVCINYVSDHLSAEKTAEEAKAFGAETLTLKADVSNRDQVKKMFDEIYQAFGKVDTLVLNAGISMVGLFTDLKDEEWDRIFDVNVKGAYLCIKEALPKMISQKMGKIVVVSSMWGLVGGSCEVAYSATKAALCGLVKGLAKELGPSGINVNGVAPGLILTEMNNNLSEEDISSFADDTPLCRAGTPDEVADLIFYLSDGKGAQFMTGQIISIDGGEVM